MVRPRDLSLIDSSQMPDGRPNILNVAEVEQPGLVEFGVLVPAGRAARLGTALAGLAHDLAGARREIAVLKRENATLKARLSSGNGELPLTSGRRRAVVQRADSPRDSAHSSGPQPIF